MTTQPRKAVRDEDATVMLSTGAGEHLDNASNIWAVQRYDELYGEERADEYKKQVILVSE